MGVNAIRSEFRPRRARRRAAGLRVAAVGIVAVIAAGACDGSFEADGIVQITPEALMWAGAPPFDASASVQQANGDPIPDTYAVAAEVTWAAPPGQEPIRRTLIASQNDAGSYEVAGIHARSAEMVTLVWEVSGTDGQSLAESESIDVQVDCADGPEPFLQDMQTAVTDIVSGLETIDGPSLVSVGYLLNNHGWAQIPGGGVSFIHLNNPLVVDMPPLLLFTAPADADITDTEPDGDLALAGWGYASPFLDNERPTLGCVPYHLWSIHEAGWHTPDDGGMVLDDGTQASADAAAGRGGSLATYHPKLWDIHFWLEPDSDTPSSSLVNVDDDGELVPPDGGADAPDGMFSFPPLPTPEGAN